MQAKKLSVVLPTYNSEKYLNNALDSVVKQTYRNIEFIIVDDCSTDSTHKILKTYAKNDERIKLHFNEKNLGVGNSRNIGIKLATGYYITFIDHDDWQDIDRYDNMIKRIEEDNTDVCFSQILVYNESTQKYINTYNIEFKKNIIDLNKKNNRKKIRDIYIPSWTRIIKKKLIMENNLQFAKNVIFEDVLFYSLLLYSLDKISIYNKPSYHQRMFENSLSSRYYSDKKFMNSQYIESFKQAQKLIRNNNAKKSFIDNYYMNSFVVHHLSFEQIKFIVLNFSSILILKKILSLLIAKKLYKKILLLITKTGYHIIAKKLYKKSFKKNIT